MSLREIARFDDHYEASVAASFLRSHDIDVFVSDSNLSTMNPLMQRALGGIRVMAPFETVAAARALLDRARTGEFFHEDGDDIAPARGGLGVTAAALAAFFLTGAYGGLAMTALKGPPHPIRTAGLILIAVVVLGSLLVWAGLPEEPAYY